MMRNAISFLYLLEPNGAGARHSSHTFPVANCRAASIVSASSTITAKPWGQGRGKLFRERRGQQIALDTALMKQPRARPALRRACDFAALRAGHRP